MQTEKKEREREREQEKVGTQIVSSTRKKHFSSIEYIVAEKTR